MCALRFCAGEKSGSLAKCVSSTVKVLAFDLDASQRHSRLPRDERIRRRRRESQRICGGIEVVHLKKGDSFEVARALALESGGAIAGHARECRGATVVLRLECRERVTKRADR